MANRFWLRRLCGGPGPDVTAPTIISATSFSCQEGVQLAHALAASEAVTWSIRTSGQNALSVDYADFEIFGGLLRWAGNGVQDYEAPNDTGTNNTYVVVIRATDTAGNVKDEVHTCTVTDVSEGLTPNAGGSFTTGAFYDVGYDSTVSISGGTPYADGTPPYRIAVTSGALPTGMACYIDMDGTARIAGVPSAVGTFTGQVTVTDAGSQSTAIDFNIPVPSYPASGISIAFGAKTLDSYGGHRCGNGAGTTMTITAGNGANHWQIVGTGSESRLAPNGAGGAGTAPPTFSGPYAITVNNGTNSWVVNITMEANKAHFRANANDTSLTNGFELKTYLSSVAFVALGDSLVMRCGRLQDLSGNTITPPSPTGGWSGAATSWITITSEWEDVSYNVKGRPNLEHGGKMPTIRINTSGNFRIPWLFHKIHFDYVYATPNDGTTQIIYNTQRSFGMSATYCAFTSNASVINRRNVAAMELRSSATVPAKFENNRVENGGKGVSIMYNQTSITSERATATRVVNNDFIGGRRDQFRFFGDDGTGIIGPTLSVVDGNLFIEPLLDTGGDHQDCIQHLGHKNGASATVPQGSICDNYFVTNGTDPAYPQCIYLDDTVGSARVGAPTIERNAIIAGLNNAIWFKLTNSPTIRFNTVIAPLNKSANGHTPVIIAVGDTGQSGVDATVQYNAANSINLSAQTGTVTNTLNQTFAISQAAYDARFANYFDGPVNRWQAKQALLPLEDGLLKNGDGTYTGPWFPDGTTNDGTVFVP